MIITLINALASAVSRVFPRETPWVISFRLPHQNPGIHGDAVFVDREMEVGAGTLAGVAHLADTLAGFHVRAGFHGYDAHVSVKRAVARVVGDNHVVTVRVVVTDLGYAPCHSGPDGRTLNSAYVKPGMKLPYACKGV